MAAPVCEILLALKWREVLLVSATSSIVLKCCNFLMFVNLGDVFWFLCFNLNLFDCYSGWTILSIFFYIFLCCFLMSFVHFVLSFFSCWLDGFLYILDIIPFLVLHITNILVYSLSIIIVFNVLHFDSAKFCAFKISQNSFPRCGSILFYWYSFFISYFSLSYFSLLGGHLKIFCIIGPSFFHFYEMSEFLQHHLLNNRIISNLWNDLCYIANFQSMCRFISGFFIHWSICCFL